MIKIGDKKISEIIFKVGDKVKKISVKMKVDNNIEDFILYSILKSMEYNSGLLLYSNHSHTIEINDLVSIEDVTVNNGEVTYSVNGNKVTINAKNGKIIKQANPTKYQKDISEYRTSSSNNFDSSLDYNKDEYSGKLSKDGSSYVDSGSYEPSASKQATDYRTSSSDSFSSSVSYNSGGYTGTLTKDGSSYVSSGSYEPSSSKQVSDYSTNTSSNIFSSTIPYSSGGYVGTLSKSGSSYVTGGEHLLADSKSYSETAGSVYVISGGHPNYPKTKQYNSNLYSGTLELKTESDWDDIIWKIIDTEISPVYNELTFRNGGVVSYTNQFFGHPFKPNVTLTVGNYHKVICTFDNISKSEDQKFLNAMMESKSKPDEDIVVKIAANYKKEDQQAFRRMQCWYEGTISRPEIDTRVWRQNYSGTVTKSGYDTRIYRQDYKGTVSKQGYDTRVWKQKYSGKVYKPGYDDRYMYLINIIYKQKTK